MTPSVLPLQSAFFQGQAFQPLSQPWANALTALLGAVQGAATPTSVVSAVVTVAAVTVTGPTVISIPDPEGSVLFVVVTQDAIGGHAVTWDTMFKYPPEVVLGPRLITPALFVGVGGHWINVLAIGRHA